MRRLLLVLAMASVVLAACSSGGATGQTSTPSTIVPKFVPVGTEDWGQDGCLMRYQDVVRGWAATGWCRRVVGVGVYDLTHTNSGSTVLFRVDDNDPTWAYWLDKTTNVQFRINKGTRVKQTRYQDLWLTDAEYTTAKLNEIAAAQLAEVEKQRQADALQQQVADIRLKIVESAGVFLQPECNFSYNGCR
jgi:hypothetical protein